MNSTTAPTLSAPAAAARGAPALARRALQLLQSLPHGRLELRLPDGAVLALPGQGTVAAGQASLQLHRWQALERPLRSGDIGLAEGYIDGDWDSPDLAGLLRLLIANRDSMDALVYGHWWGRLAYRLRHLLQRNSRSGSARNIHAHYDLGNAFYRLWLDPSMNYSAAWFQGRRGLAMTQADLQTAQQAKMWRALAETGIQPGQQLLEIGCGWGSLAQMAAREAGARVTGITLSKAQLDWGRQQVQAAGLQEQVELRYQDYRDLAVRHREAFDAIVSIEMFEAVGQSYWRGYFETVRDCLKPGGRACIQTITLREDLFARYQRSTDFIQQYIFPGGFLPSIPAFEAEARRAGLVVERRLQFGRDYAETLRRWRAAFEQRLDAAAQQGFDLRFQRIWRFYLAYCEAAFDMGNTDVVQFTLHKPSL